MKATLYVTKNNLLHCPFKPLQPATFNTLYHVQFLLKQDRQFLRNRLDLCASVIFKDVKLTINLADLHQRETQRYQWIVSWEFFCSAERSRSTIL